MNQRSATYVGCLMVLAAPVIGVAIVVMFDLGPAKQSDRVGAPPVKRQVPSVINTSRELTPPALPRPEPRYETLWITDARDPKSEALFVENRVALSVYTPERDDAMLWAIVDVYRTKYSTVDQLDLMLYNKKIYPDPHEVTEYRYENGKRVSEAAFDKIWFAEYVWDGREGRKSSDLRILPGIEGKDGRDIPRP